MLGYRKNSFLQAHELLGRLHSKLDDMDALRDLQQLLCREIIRAEKKGREIRGNLKAIQSNAGAAGQKNTIWLRKFAPNTPVVFPAVAGELAILEGNAPQRLVQFHNGLGALRREIENNADATSQLGSVQISTGQIKAVASRMRLTLEPALKALQELAPMVPDAREIERDAIASIDATRAATAPSGTLQDRIKRLLELPH